MKKSDAQSNAILEIQSEVFDSLYSLCKYLGMHDLNEHTHGDVIDLLESNYERKMIVLPRGTLKTSLGVVGYAIWRIIRDPDIRILLESETYKNAKNLLREIKAHLTSPHMTELFGDPVGSVWKESEITVGWRTRNRKEATITVGSPGVIAVGQHYDLIINDDMNSQNNTNTKDNRDKIVDHYKRNIAILDPGEEYVIIGTRYHEEDLIGHILTHEVEGGLEIAKGSSTHKFQKTTGLMQGSKIKGNE